MRRTGMSGGWPLGTGRWHPVSQPPAVTWHSAARPRSARARLLGYLPPSDGAEPLHVPRLQAAHRAEEDGLDLLRDRAHLADPDAAIVDFAHGRDLRRRAAHERLVGAVEVVARKAALLDRDPLVLGDAEDALARDPFQDAARDRRRVEGAVADEEDVL